MEQSVPRVLVLDAATGGGLAALVQGGTVLRECRSDTRLGIAAALPGMVAEVLADTLPDLIAVTVGPGSFTGIRAALSLAHGLAQAGKVALVGVTVSEALMQEPGPGGTSLLDRVRAEGRTLLVALDSRRGRVFLDRGDGPRMVALGDLATLAGPVTMAGDAAAEVAAGAPGSDIVVAGRPRPGPLGIAAAAMLRHRGQAPPLAAHPLYIDAPEIRSAALRPAPA